MRSSLRKIAFLALLTSLAGGPAAAQTYPNRSVRLVVGFAPGGPADVLARIVAQRMGDGLKQPLVIENRPGAGGTIGAAAVATSTPDGYTLLFVSSGHAGSGALYPKLPYDPVKSFAPVAGIAATPVIIIANAAAPYRTLNDLVAAARAQPGKLNYGSGGGGATLTSLTADVFKSAARLDLVQINYKGAGPAMTALLGGEIDLAFDTVSGAIGQVKAGKVRALAVTSRTRSAALPDVPTVAETAVPGFEAIGWFGLLAPAGTPPAIVDRLNRDANAVLQSAEMRERLKELGADALAGSPADFGRLIESETARWGDVIRKLGIRAD